MRFLLRAAILVLALSAISGIRAWKNWHQFFHEKTGQLDESILQKVSSRNELLRATVVLLYTILQSLNKFYSLILPKDEYIIYLRSINDTLKSINNMQ